MPITSFNLILLNFSHVNWLKYSKQTRDYHLKLWMQILKIELQYMVNKMKEWFGFKRKDYNNNTSSKVKYSYDLTWIKFMTLIFYPAYINYNFVKGILCCLDFSFVKKIENRLSREIFCIVHIKYALYMRPFEICSLNYNQFESCDLIWIINTAFNKII